MTEEKKEEEQKTSVSVPADAKVVVGKKATADKEKKEVPAKFKKLVEEVEKMSVLDLSELVKILEDHFGVSSAPAMMATAPVAGGSAEGGDKAEEKSSFNVELTESGDNKISVIKVIRQITQQGLK